MLLSCPFLGANSSGEKIDYCIKERCQFYDRKSQNCVIATIGEASLRYLTSSKMITLEKELEREESSSKNLDKNEKKEKYSIYLSKAYRLFKLRMFADCELELRRAIVYNKKGFDAYNLLGKVCIELNKTDEAVISFKEALKIRKEAQVVKNLIEQYEALYSEFPEKDKFYREIIERFGEEVEGAKSEVSYYAIACCYFIFKFSNISDDSRFELCYSNLQKSVEIKKNFSESYFLMFELNKQYNILKDDEVIDYMIKAKDYDKENPLSYLYLSRAYLEHGNSYDSEKVLENIKKAVKLDEDNWEILYHYGKIMESYQFFPKAVNQYIKALEICPFNVKVLERLARVYEISNLYDKTITVYNELIERDCTNEKYLSKLGELSLLRLDYEQALKHYSGLLELFPFNGEYYKNYYICIKNTTSKDEWENILSEIKKETELETYNYIKFVHLGYSSMILTDDHTKEPELSNIIDTFKRIISIEPDFVYAYWVLASLYIDAQKNNEAYEMIEKIKKLNIEEAYIYDNLSDVLFRLSETQNAVEFLEKAINIDPECKTAYKKLMNIHDIDSEADKLEDIARKVIKIYPNEFEAYYYLGRISHKDNDDEKAMDYLRKAVEINPVSEKSNFLLARIYEENTMFDLAKSYYKKTVEINSDNCSALYSLGKLYKKDKDNDKAEVYLKKSIEKNHENANAYIELARLYSDRDSLGLAANMYEKAISYQEDIWIRFELSEVFIKVRKYDSAIKTLKVILEKDSENIKARLRLGEVYAEMNLLESAQEEFKKII
ncbi:MAG: tetratricopeptide repeat protein, partial [Candidatus Muirbacterium halophilum]|nr:tetratricopeptide repeat protein [Candidatus Muirbacterium halophilum]